MHGVEAAHDHRVGDAAPDVRVDGEGDVAHEQGLAEEDDVVVLGEILEEEAQLAEGLDLEQMRIIDEQQREPRWHIIDHTNSDFLQDSDP